MRAAEAKSLEELLHVVARARALTSVGEPWDYGWCVEEYRRSSNATASGPQGLLVRLSPEGVESLENAMAALLARESVRRAWDHEELWSVVLTAVTTLPMSSATDQPEVKEVLRQRLDRVLSPGPTFVAFELANVAWSGLPRVIADAVLGAASNAWIEMVREASAGRPIPSQEHLLALADCKGPGGGVLYGAWTPAHGARAQRLTEQRFEETAALALLLQDDLNALELFSGRGDAHRPGIRGLTVDRRGLAALKTAGKELSARPVIAGPAGQYRSTQWWGAEPFQLDRLLAGPERCASIGEIVGSDDAVFRRFATAATWYAKSHWSKRREDSVLALGIVFDALLGDRSGLPGRVLADRFGLLEAKPERRAERAKRFGELYSARSAVAHGGHPSAIDEPNFERAMAADARWAAAQVLGLVRALQVRSDDGYRSMFEELKWGTKQHPPPVAGDDQMAPVPQRQRGQPCGQRSPGPEEA